MLADISLGVLAVMLLIIRVKFNCSLRLMCWYFGWSIVDGVKYRTYHVDPYWIQPSLFLLSKLNARSQPFTVPRFRHST